MAEEDCVLLGPCAAEVSSVIRSATLQRRIKPSEACYPLAYDIAVRLHLINEYLDSLPPSWIDPDIKEMCQTLWGDLQDVVMPRPQRGFISSWIFGKPEPPSLEANVLDFLRTETAKAESLKTVCDKLVQKLTRDEINKNQEIPDSVLSKINAADMSPYFNDGVFDALQSLSECNPKSHKTLAETDQELSWHRTRLSLAESDDEIRVLVPNRNMVLWQEFSLRTYVSLLTEIAASLMASCGKLLPLAILSFVLAVMKKVNR